MESYGADPVVATTVALRPCWMLYVELAWKFSMTACGSPRSAADPVTSLVT
jgi:hypothetical protein